MIKGRWKTEKCIILDEIDDADRVSPWENDLQFKKVRKSHNDFAIPNILQYRDNVHIMGDSHL